MVAMIAHREALVSADRQVRTGIGSAGEDKSSLAVRRIVTARFRLVPFSSAFDAAGATQAPALQAHGRQIESGTERGHQNYFVFAHLEDGFRAIR
jgi:hypothetical protein